MIYFFWFKPYIFVDPGSVTTIHDALNRKKKRKIPYTDFDIDEPISIPEAESDSEVSTDKIEFLSDEEEAVLLFFLSSN